jgi:hypothetical protein
VRTLVAALVAAVLIPVSAGSASAEECPWWATQLPLPTGYNSSRVDDAAEGGWFIGDVYGPGDVQVARWHDGEVELLGSAFDTQTALTDINSSGVAVGAAPPGGPHARAIIYRDGGYELLAEAESGAASINAAGDVLGFIGQDTVVWPATGGVRVIDAGPGYGWQNPREIDDQGNVLVNALREGGFDTLVVRPDGTVTKLDALAPGEETNGTDMKGGRIVGTTSHEINGFFESFAIEWNMAGQIVHRLPEQNVFSLFVDSGNTLAGNLYLDDGRNDTNIWRGGVRVLALSSGYSELAALTDDGVLAATERDQNWSYVRAMQYKRSC